MTKVKLTISIDEEIAKDLRNRSIEKYGNSRSLSQLIEDLATGSAEPAPPVCQIGLMSKWAISQQEEFNKAVEFVSRQVDGLKFPGDDMIPEKTWSVCGPEEYFVFKEASELRLNRLAESINKCWGCAGLDEPLPIYPDAGRNFDNLYLISRRHR